MAKGEQYARSPKLGERCEDIGPGVHSFRVGNYSILYRPVTGGIVILLVVHSARDIQAVFRDVFGTEP
jgi:toxin ParE1/3/4